MPSKYGDKVDRFYHSTRWRKARLATIAEHRGICQMCRKRRGTEVHHIIPLTAENVDDPEIALGRENLMLLCKECHDAIRHAEENKGGVAIEFDSNGEAVVMKNPKRM